MNYPLFHVGEAVRVGPEAYDRRMIGRVCKVESIKAPVQGEWRYLISTERGARVDRASEHAEETLPAW